MAHNQSAQGTPPDSTLECLEMIVELRPSVFAGAFRHLFSILVSADVFLLRLGELQYPNQNGIGTPKLTTRTTVTSQSTFATVN
jgi:hypothetical protein